MKKFNGALLNPCLERTIFILQHVALPKKFYSAHYENTINFENSMEKCPIFSNLNQMQKCFFQFSRAFGIPQVIFVFH
jgi:hypothetical protein